MDDFDVQGKERELDELLSEVKSLLDEDEPLREDPMEDTGLQDEASEGPMTADDVNIDFEKFYDDAAGFPDEGIYTPPTAYEQSKSAYQVARRAEYERMREAEREARDRQRVARDREEERNPAPAELPEKISADREGERTQNEFTVHYIPNTPRTLSNSVPISPTSIISTMTIPVIETSVACSSLPALLSIWQATVTIIPIPATFMRVETSIFIYPHIHKRSMTAATAAEAHSVRTRRLYLGTSRRHLAAARPISPQ